MSSKKKRKRYSTEFKINSVKAWRESGKSATEYGREFDLPENYLYNWAKIYETDAGIVSTSEYEGMKRLRKEVKELRLEAEIWQWATLPSQSSPI